MYIILDGADQIESTFGFERCISEVVGNSLLFTDLQLRFLASRTKGKYIGMRE